MQQYNMTSAQWLETGIKTGWIKEASWFDKRTPFQKQYDQSVKSLDQEKRDALARIENYSKTIQQIHQVLEAINTDIKEMPEMLAYLSGIQGGTQLVNNLRGIDNVAKSFYTADKFFQSIMRHIISTGEVPNMSALGKINLEETPPAQTHSVDEPEVNPIETEQASTSAPTEQVGQEEFNSPQQMIDYINAHPEFQLVWNNKKTGAKEPVAINQKFLQGFPNKIRVLTLDRKTFDVKMSDLEFIKK